LPEGSGDQADPEDEVLGGHVGQDDQEDLRGQVVDGGGLLKEKKRKLNDFICLKKIELQF
jgi:hypothetical protein